jgi:hypothetical protein
MKRSLRMLGAALVVAASAITVSAQKSTADYKGPRTPWGDPDLQGNYTNLGEAGTPMERPKQYDGLNLNDIKPEERAKIKKKLAEDTIGRFLGPTEAPDNWWQPAYGKFVENGAQLWFVIDPADGKIPAMTAEAQKKREAAAADNKTRAYKRDHPDWVTDLNLYDRCITRGYPGSMLPSIYGNAYVITQAPGAVAITMEMVHETRVIPLDGRPHASKNTHLDMGDARGHWEGDTLVVESTNFRDRSAYQNANADRLKLVERFTRTGPHTVRWQVTVDDPTTWTRPWTFAMPLTQDDSQPFMPYECHEGNYGVPNILSATRAEEKAAAAKK